MIGVAKLAPGPGQLALHERPEPVAGPGEVVLDVRAAGICGTDLHIEAGEYACVPPVTLGHEVCGVVAALGDGVEPAWLGARVVAETFFSTCGCCPSCLAGRPNLCPERRSIGTHVDGAFAPRLRVPARNLHRVPEPLDDAAAALTEPLACVLNALDDPPAIAPGDDVLVIGPGAIGLIAAQVARAAGGRVHVRGAPRDAQRLALAASLGLATSDAATPYDGPTPAVVIECSGSAAGVADALRLCGRRGTVVQLGICGRDVTLPYDQICLKELAVRTGFAHTPAAWPRALRLLADGAVTLGPLVTATHPLEAFADAFARSRAADGVKHVLVPG